MEFFVDVETNSCKSESVAREGMEMQTCWLRAKTIFVLFFKHHCLGSWSFCFSSLCFDHHPSIVADRFVLISHFSGLVIQNQQFVRCLKFCTSVCRYSLSCCLFGHFNIRSPGQIMSSSHLGLGLWCLTSKPGNSWWLCQRCSLSCTVVYQLLQKLLATCLPLPPPSPPSGTKACTQIHSSNRGMLTEWKDISDGCQWLSVVVQFPCQTHVFI